MRILITGDRNWTDADRIYWALAKVQEKYPGRHVFVHGACRGADTMGARVAADLGWAVEAYPAEWGKHGKAAGMLRNRQMLDTGPDYVIAFHNDIAASTGTRGMMRIALQAGLSVLLVTSTGGHRYQPGDIV